MLKRSSLGQYAILFLASCFFAMNTHAKMIQISLNVLEENLPQNLIRQPAASALDTALFMGAFPACVSLSALFCSHAEQKKALFTYIAFYIITNLPPVLLLKCGYSPDVSYASGILTGLCSLIAVDALLNLKKPSSTTSNTQKYKDIPFLGTLGALGACSSHLFGFFFLALKNALNHRLNP